MSGLGFLSFELEDSCSEESFDDEDDVDMIVSPPPPPAFRATQKQTLPPPTNRLPTQSHNNANNNNLKKVTFAPERTARFGSSSNHINTNTTTGNTFQPVANVGVVQNATGETGSKRSAVPQQPSPLPRSRGPNVTASEENSNVKDNKGASSTATAKWNHNHRKGTSRSDDDVHPLVKKGLVQTKQSIGSTTVPERRGLVRFTAMVATYRM